MKIGFVYDVPYPWHVGGIESMNFNEAQELAKGNEVHYFTTKWPGMKENEFKKDKIQYHAYGETDQDHIYRNGRRSMLEAFFFKLSLSNMFNHKLDVVVTNQFPILHLPMVKLYCLVTNTKLVMEVAEVWDMAYWRSYLGPTTGSLAYNYQRLWMGCADAYITISSKTTAELRKEGIPKGRIREFAPAVDDKLLSSIKKSKARRAKTIIFSGRLIKEKRVDKWIDAFAKAAKKDKAIKGIIIGSGPEKAAIQSQIKSAGLSGRITIRDFFNDNSKFYHAVRNSSLMLNMSEREGLGIIAIEGVALGTPVLVPDYTPLPAEVKEMCIVASEKDIPALIVEIANNKNKDRYIRNTGNLKRFSKSRIKEFYSNLFTDIGVGKAEVYGTIQKKPPAPNPKPEPESVEDL